MTKERFLVMFYYFFIVISRSFGSALPVHSTNMADFEARWSTDIPTLVLLNFPSLTLRRKRIC